MEAISSRWYQLRSRRSLRDTPPRWKNEMIKVFADSIQAYLYKAEMEAEGKNAYVLDEHSPFLYGPIAASGVRVLVSEKEEIDYEDTEPSLASRLFSLAWTAFKILVIAILALEVLSKPGAYFILGLVLALCLLSLLLIAIPLGMMSHILVEKMKTTWFFTALAVTLATLEFIL